MPNNVSIEGIKRYLDYGQETHDIKPASDWSADVIDLIMNPNDFAQGLPIHYMAHTDDLRFRGGEVSIWNGINGHGKSMLLSQLVLAGMFTERFGIISPEMMPKRQLQRMTYQACRMRHPNPDQMQAFHKFTDERLWLYDQQGRIDQKMLFACIRYMAHELKITHVVIDSLMKCLVREDDYNEQKEFVNQLTSLAKEFNIHIHLVTHSRKSDKESNIPDKFDIKGSGAIADLVDNILIVWRNKGKESKLARNNISDTDRRKFEQEPDAGLICVKQRHHDWEGSIWLNYHSPSMNLLNGCDTPASVDWVAVLGEVKAA